MRALASRGVAEPFARTAEIEREIASCVASHDSLVEWLASCRDVEPGAASSLPRWTIGHVMTHIARNGDSVLSMLDGAPQYPHGREGRNADIEAGATRSWAELVADVTATAVAVSERLTSGSDWTGTVEMITGERPASLVPLLRQREVEVHRSDLGLGYRFADMPSDYVRRDLRLMEMLWRARKPMGMTPLPDAALALEPGPRLAWMMGRIEVDGLDPADLF